MHRFILAWQLLTIIPLKQVSWDREDLGNSMTFFPIVGLFLGGSLFIANWVLTPLLPRPLVDLMLLLLLTILTGGLHLDGFADTVDGLAGGTNREEALKIMKDGRVGAFAVIALIFLLGIKFVALEYIQDEIKGLALLLTPVVGRWAMVLGATVSRAARSEGGLGKPYLEHQGPMTFFLASAICLFIAQFLFWWKGFLLITAVGLIVLMILAYVHRRIGGITGDVLGAINEVSEAFVLVLIVGTLH